MRFRKEIYLVTVFQWSVENQHERRTMEKYIKNLEQCEPDWTTTKKIEFLLFGEFSFIFLMILFDVLFTFFVECMIYLFMRNKI